MIAQDWRASHLLRGKQEMLTDCRRWRPNLVPARLGEQLLKHGFGRNSRTAAKGRRDDDEAKRLRNNNTDEGASKRKRRAAAKSRTGGTATLHGRARALPYQPSASPTLVKAVVMLQDRD